MGKIQILPEIIASKIAAGEVIERPSSVVKELIENSIDADAKKITIILVKSGKNLIVVRDNGLGIEKDDIPLLFQRHSTSKIKSFEDLFKIDSMGFRGEALYSIASVSEVFLRSKTSRDETGWEIQVKNGVKTDPRPVSMQNGTEIEVHNLFANIPARRKFLKSDNAEFKRILNVLIPYMILYPSISFYLIHNKKKILELHAGCSELRRIGEIFNIDEKYLIEISWKSPDNSISLKMISGNTDINRAKKDIQFIFVNKRPVQHSAFSFIINDIYRNFLPPETYPVFALFLQIRKEDVDVNVHPTKREVRIRNESEILDTLKKIVEKNLFQMIQPKTFSYQIKIEPSHQHASEKSEEYKNLNIEESLFGNGPQPSYEPKDFRKDFIQSKYIATILSTYLLFEYNERLFIVDQHAAHERIIFEKLLAQVNKGKVITHQLLIPVSVPLTAIEMINWKLEGKTKLEKIGFQTTQWDSKTIAIHSCPEGIKKPELAVRNILSEGVHAFDIETILKKACRGSTMSGQQLSSEEAEALKIQLVSCNNPLTCPHGRPTIVEIERKFIEKMFLR
ncbi:MAG: DNA mismatch repair endonuclease MutL [bacterium]|nr:DNA mismatch repair endonuclease MutL [bacterium]